MAFKSSRRFGKYSKDACQMDSFISSYHFNTSAKSERDFEYGFSSALINAINNFSTEVMSQVNNETTVKSVYCFGKKHRPDIALGESIIGLELKLINYAGLKDAIGQGFLYRIHYRYVFLVLVISKERKNFYQDLCEGQESSLENMLQYLADTMNIFTYIVPAFGIKPGMKKQHSFFEPLNKIVR